MSNARDKANIPALNFSSTGIDDNATSTAITINSSEYVGINTTSPQRYLHITGNDGASGTNSGNSDTQLFIDNGGLNGGIIEFGAIATGKGMINFSSLNGTNRGSLRYWHSDDHLELHTASSERMRIDSSGRVGIGTSSPSEKLDVSGTIKATAFQGDGSALTGVSAGVAGISSSADATAITIDSSERVGIGTTSPNAMLEVGTDVLIDSSSGFYGNRLAIGNPNPNQTSNGGYGFGFHNSGAFFWTMSDTNSYWNTTNPNGYHYINLRSRGSACGSIVLQSSSTSYNTSSDYRLKENIVDMSDATTRLKSLSPKRFNFIAEPNKTVDGFLAHEVSSIVPEAISGEKDAVNEDGSIKPQGIDQSKLVPLLVATIQELEARITALETQP